MGLAGVRLGWWVWRYGGEGERGREVGGRRRRQFGWEGVEGAFTFLSPSPWRSWVCEAFHSALRVEPRNGGGGADMRGRERGVSGMAFLITKVG